ncbi:hypothetical protein [Xanthomarina sp. F2636L]|uniref:hypothetical protein n=1 Tax=Xanthomarina sp. F2636L TaxID=2996018 RepID=UPI00225E6E40|nr:hypothetical protein [Xanthomarina sp. F2636L]MCX7549367.1 hypothetical protein [Xanthomarina sp. F2636L]
MINCKLFYIKSPHLSQIYDGFEKLQRKGLINLVYENSKGDVGYPLLKVLINEKTTLVYDLLDTNKIDEAYLKSLKTDYYFKRSFPLNMIGGTEYEGAKIFPLGFNYPISKEGKYKYVKQVLNDFGLVKGEIRKNTYPSEIFEAFPTRNKVNKVLFYCNLWNPYIDISDKSKMDRQEINENRIAIIQTLKKEFGTFFKGGLISTKFSLKTCKELVVPRSLTNKNNYLKEIKSSNICISTTGLHGSVGWNFGEYMAASRAIITMPLNSKFPGNLVENGNYLVFNNQDELVQKVEFLLNNSDAQQSMMIKNFRYYNNYLKPENLVLNTLLEVL